MSVAEPTAAAETWHAAAVEPAENRGKRDLAQVILQHWERLGISDGDEQAIYTGQLASVDFIPDAPTDLSPAEQQTVIDRLAGCDDIGQVRALLDRGDKPGGDAA